MLGQFSIGGRFATSQGVADVSTEHRHQDTQLGRNLRGLPLEGQDGLGDTVRQGVFDRLQEEASGQGKIGGAVLVIEPRIEFDDAGLQAAECFAQPLRQGSRTGNVVLVGWLRDTQFFDQFGDCLLYTSDAADE